MLLTLTVLQVANALLKLEAPDSTQLAIVPMVREQWDAKCEHIAMSAKYNVLQGTANDLATSLEVPVEPGAALELALAPGDGQPIDIGLVNDQVPIACSACL